MKKLILSLVLLGAWTVAAAQWAPVGDKIKTEWAAKVDPSNVWPEYPRPIMQRADWINLNGLWNYAITDKGNQQPSAWEGKILVPFCVESSLSGVGKTLGEKKELWYERAFEIPAAWKGKRVMLNFGGVDWKADVWVNGIKAGQHTGGFAPFSLDITETLATRGNTLVVRVWDPTDKSFQPRGKQVSNPGGIFYTPVSGIWQTVWLEPVVDAHITDIRTTPDVDAGRLTVQVGTSCSCPSNVVEVSIYDGGQKIASGKCVNGQAAELSIPDAKLWSPDSPFLYDVKVTLSNGGKITDQVDSYAAMRKFSLKKDGVNITRMQLNNKDFFQFGPLDQGWWPDGLYTAPSDEALAYDVVKTKDLGFNMIRKHVKVEPARWYYHCDRLGMIVWQDMPSGGENPGWDMHNYWTGVESKRSPQSAANFYKEWKEVMDFLYSYPSIGVWVPFNEAWGQFDTEAVATWTKQQDPSRLVNPASGGNHYRTGDILDLHNYPAPAMYLYDSERATVLGEYGGIGMPLEGHTWETGRNWGYVQFGTPKEVTDEYVKYAEQLKDLIKKGYSAAVYTQTTDVESEVNGFMTYDRKVVKLEQDRAAKVNREVCRSLDK